MSEASAAPAVGDLPNMADLQPAEMAAELTRHFTQRAQAGDPTWLEDAIEAYLGITVTDAQAEICRSIVENEKTIAVMANGLGKSYILAAITIVWLIIKYPAVSFATSGTEKKMRRTYCRPVENLHSQAVVPLPGEYKSRPERIEFEEEPEHYFEATSPKDAGELEGVHSAYTLAIIEEADKEDIDADVIDSMESLITDDRDRIIAIANPPEDETNIVYDLMNDRTWNTVQMSSFEAHNVQVELGEKDGEKIDGISSLDKIKKDWESFNGLEWPGAEEARNSYGEPGLDKRWYRRRLGRIPPDGADVLRPFERGEVEGAFVPRASVNYPKDGPIRGIAYDVARTGGDSNVVAAVHGDDIIVHDEWSGVDHVENEQTVKSLALMSRSLDVPFAIDANGEGSGVSDYIDKWYPNVIRFDAGEEALEGEEYYSRWGEGLHLLGQFLRNGRYTDRRLREELLAAARVIEYEEKYYSSREAEVWKATSKSDLKDSLGRSPDVLDAAYMAVWAAEGEFPTGGLQRRSGSSAGKV
ncbi:terminase large subunit domain-containing protein [Natronococcus roseus]|uniref:terminase large subunit domain-containing protein n=1 Tax=Natronococcus roseus TaxID=1052014 RepID=UPI00374D9181